MNNSVEYSFESETKLIPIDRLSPSKPNPPSVKITKRYKQIVSSVELVGLVEPVVVFPIAGEKDQFMILDGHLRVAVLQELGKTQVRCLIARDDEIFTYNKRINRITSVQEHYMILRAVKNGVSEEKIAKALGIKIDSVRRKKGLLDGICPEVVDLLKHSELPVETAKVLRRLVPIRQIEVVKLMMAANNMSGSYAKALYMASNPSMLRQKRRQRVGGVSNEERERMERELSSIQRDIRAVEENYGANMLRLVVANGYIGRLLRNAAVAEYLERHHVSLYEQLSQLRESIDADVGVSSSSNL